MAASTAHPATIRKLPLRGESMKELASHQSGQTAIHRAAAERGQHDESSCSETGIRGSQPKLIAQQRWQVDRERDESAKGQKIECRQCPRQRLAGEYAEHLRQALGASIVGSVASEDNEQHCPGQKDDRHSPIDSAKPSTWHTA